ncbi:hypothetical protein HDV05_005482 [Chytridiales sp. JEL 0842]|nr:hypothetical protein HDV05_005482 [Chytridiales sp. JEL 0842]
MVKSTERSPGTLFTWFTLASNPVPGGVRDGLIPLGPQTTEATPEDCVSRCDYNDLCAYVILEPITQSSGRSVFNCQMNSATYTPTEGHSMGFLISPIARPARLVSGGGGSTTLTMTMTMTMGATETGGFVTGNGAVTTMGGGRSGGTATTTRGKGNVGPTSVDSTVGGTGNGGGGSSSVLPAAIGGAVGGVLVLALGVFGFLLYRKRRTSKETKKALSGSSVPPANSSNSNNNSNNNNNNSNSNSNRNSHSDANNFSGAAPVSPSRKNVEDGSLNFKKVNATTAQLNAADSTSTLQTLSPFLVSTSIPSAAPPSFVPPHQFNNSNTPAALPAFAAQPYPNAPQLAPNNLHPQYHYPVQNYNNLYPNSNERNSQLYTPVSPTFTNFGPSPSPVGGHYSYASQGSPYVGSPFQPGVANLSYERPQSGSVMSRAGVPGQQEQQQQQGQQQVQLFESGSEKQQPFVTGSNNRDGSAGGLFPSTLFNQPVAAVDNNNNNSNNNSQAPQPVDHRDSKQQIQPTTFIGTSQNRGYHHHQPPSYPEPAKFATGSNVPALLLKRPIEDWIPEDVFEYLKSQGVSVGVQTAVMASTHFQHLNGKSLKGLTMDQLRYNFSQLKDGEVREVFEVVQRLLWPNGMRGVEGGVGTISALPAYE